MLFGLTNLKNTAMGMYDSIYIDVECPHCGKKSTMEVQTKELGCGLMTFRKGDYVSDKHNYIIGITNCELGTCKTSPQYFRLKVFLHSGKINGKYKIIGW